MFGIGFTEILMILVVALLFLGPDKLPEAMVQVAKFIGSAKRMFNEAKASFEEEVHLKELKEEALGYKQQLEEHKEDISGFKNAFSEPITQLNSELADISSSYSGRKLNDPWDYEDDEDDKKDVKDTKVGSSKGGVEGFKNSTKEVKS